MKLLYIAYSCSPIRGSEDRIGWMLPLTAAQNHEVYVLTREERRPEIEAFCAENPISVRFLYARTPAAARMLFRGRAYSLRLNLWHREALILARDLCRREKIDVIHQITPVEFRSIGDYGSIPGVRFLCGPVGGGEYIPRPLWRYMGHCLPMEGVRAVLNGVARRRLKNSGILRRCDGLLFANRETERWLAPVMPDGLSLGICPEVGAEDSAIVHRLAEDDKCRQKGEEITFLVASRLIGRKGHALLLDAMASLPRELPWKLIIAGEGPEEKRLKKRSQKLGISDRVRFLGRVPFSNMEEVYSAADILVLPSLRETTGSVVLEAMARGLPLITLNRFGTAELVTEETGWLCAPSAASFREALLDALSHPGEISRRGRNAAAAMKKQEWAGKADCYQKIYQTLTAREV